MHSETSPFVAIVVVAFIAAIIAGAYSLFVKMIRSEGENAVRLFEEMKTWPSVEGVISSSSVKKEDVRYRNSQLGQSTYEVKTSFSPDIHYKFTVDGKEYEGRRVTLVEDVSFYEDSPLLRHVRASYPAGKKIRVYYNRENPADCLLSLNSDMSKFREKAEFSLFTLMKGALLDPVLLNALRVMFIVPILVIAVIVGVVVRGYFSNGVYGGNGWIPGLLFFALLMVPPLLMKIVVRREGARLQVKADDARRWPTAIAEVFYISSDDGRAPALVGETNPRNTTVIPAILYTFKVNGEVYTGNQLVFAQSFWKPDKNKIGGNKWDMLKCKGNASVFYNENDPFESVLDPGSVNGINELKRFTLVGVF